MTAYFIFHIFKDSEALTHYFYRQMTSFQSRIDQNSPPRAIYFIGDSQIQGLAVSAVTPLAINYGIGNDTTAGVIKRIPLYNSLNTAKAVSPLMSSKL